MGPEADPTRHEIGGGEPWFRALLDALPVAVVAIDRNADVIVWNPAAERMFGRGNGVALAQLPPICPPEWLIRIHGWFNQSLQGQSVGPLDAIGRREGGCLLDISFSSAPLRDADGNIVGAIGVFSDVTEQKRAEDQRMILGRLGTRLAACASVEGVLDVVREESERLLGWDAHYFAVRHKGGDDDTFRTLSVIDTVEGRKQTFPGRDWKPDRDSIRSRHILDGKPILVNRTPGSSEPAFTRIGDEGRLSLSIIDAPVCSGDTVIAAISAQSYTPYRYGEADLRLLQQIADIVAPTLERVRAEESLRRREEEGRHFREQLTALIEVRDELMRTRAGDGFFRRALELGRDRLGFDRLSIWLLCDVPGMQQGTFGTDESGRIRDERSTCIPVGVVGRTILASPRPLAVVTDGPLTDDRGNVVGQGTRACAAITDGKKVTGFLWADTLLSQKRFSGNERELLALYAASLGFLLSHQRDAEELARHRAHLEELVGQRTRELAESRERLQISERLASIGTLAGGIAHEINNPIGMILLAAENAMRIGDGPGAADLLRRALAKIAGNARRCGHIVQSVLQFARQEPAEKWPNDPNEMVRHAVEQTAQYAGDVGVAARVELAADLPFVVANPVQIEQALANLIRNAVEAGARGGCVTVHTEGDAGSVRVIIEDDGRGMTPEQKRRVFDPFFTTRQHQGGTGLGLSICHGIITEHAGTIDIQSQLGCGTTVTITLPAGAGDSREAPDAQGARG